MAVVQRSIASFVLLGLVFLSLMLPSDQTESVDDPAPAPIEILELMQAVENGEIEDAAKKAADQFGLTAAGDTCMMRHRRVLSGVPRSVRQQLAAARIDEGSAGTAILAQLEPDLFGSALWRLHIQQADLAVRSGDVGSAAVALNKANTVPDVPPICQSDALLLEARIAMRSGNLTRASVALEAATQADQVNFNAHFERAVLAVQRLSTGGEDCMAAIPDMVDSTIRIQALIGASSQLWRLNERAAQLTVPQPYKAFLVGFIQERAGADRQAMDTYTKAIGQLRSDRDHCATALASALRLSLERVLRTANAATSNSVRVTR